MFNEFLKEYGLFIAFTVFFIIVILIILFLLIPRIKKEAITSEVTVDKTHFLSLLGEGNVISITRSGSRLSVVLADQSLADIEELKKHGVDRVIVMNQKLVLLVTPEVAELFDKFP